MDNFFTINCDFNSIIKKHFSSPQKIEKVSNGWTNFVFKVSYENDNYFFRFPRNNFFSNALVNEVEYNKFLRKNLKMKTSELEIFYYENKPYSLHKEIKGYNLQEKYATMSLEEKECLAKDISLFIQDLQNLDYSSLKLIKLSEFLKDLSSFSNPHYDLHMHDNLIIDENEKMVLNHGDLNPGNIIVDDENKIIAVLDFAFLTKSCLLNDLARITGRLDEEFKNIMIKQYEKTMNVSVDKNKLNALITMWNYVDNSYINYMKTSCPDVVIPKT